MFPMSLLLIMRSMTKSMINQAKALWSNDHKRRVTRPVTPTCPAAASQGWAHCVCASLCLCFTVSVFHCVCVSLCLCFTVSVLHCVCVSLWQITVASPVCVLNRQNYLHIKEHNILVSHTYGLWNTQEIEDWVFWRNKNGVFFLLQL